MNYFEIECLSSLYLEDSYVLGVEEDKTKVVFNMEFVLTEKHYLYAEPLKNEQYCYRAGKMVFSECNSIEWLRRDFIPYKDKKGEVDYGNIDSFVFEGTDFCLQGDWGKVRISCPKITVEFEK